MQTTEEKDLDCFIKEHAIDCDATWIPWDGCQPYRLRWTITLRVGGRAVRTCEFSAGIGHAPSYPAQVAYDECRTGLHKGNPIQPQLRDVVYSLAMDARALDYASFEDWAGDFGLDTDSRKAEAMYRECLACGVQLRAALGSEDFGRLLELCS